MSNEPIHLFDKATWESFTEDGRWHVGYTSDVLTDATRERYAALGDVFVESWSVYRTADGSQVFTVNPDGTLRSIKPWVSVTR